MRRYLSAAMCALIGAASALAGFSEMGERLPTDTNSFVAMNMDALMQTPLAKQEDWLTRWSSMYEAGPLLIPPGTQRVLSGSRLQKDLERAKWRMAIMEMSQQIPMQDIARNEGGTTEKLWNKPAVVTPTGAYFIALQSDVLASIVGTDRQFVMSWIRDERPAGPSSPFIKQAIGTLGANTQVVLALDVQDQYSAQEIQRAIEADPLKATGDEKVNAEVLAQMLASIQNLIVQVQVAESAKAQLNLQFGMDVKLMEFYAKPLMMEILNRNGFAMPEIKDWKVQVNGKQMVMEGELGRNSLRNILGFVTGPMPAYADARATQVSDDPAVIGKASQAYYRSISAIIDNYAGQPNYSEAAGWLRQEAQRIDRLPVVNVDPELAAWGAAVGAKMREAAAMLKGDQMTGLASAQGVSSNYGDGYYNSGYYGDGYYDGWGGGGYRDRGAAVARADAQRQRTQKITEQKADSMKKAADMLNGLVQERAQLRVKMTDKYKIPF